MGETITRTLPENMKLSTEKQRTPEELAAQLERVASALGRRAARSSEIIEASNTEDNTITAYEYLDDAHQVRHRRVSNTDPQQTVETKIFASGDGKEDTRFSKKSTEDGVFKAHAGARIDSGEVIADMERAEDRHEAGRRAPKTLTPEQTKDFVTHTVRQTRQEIARRENEHKAKTAASSEELDDIMAA